MLLIMFYFNVPCHEIFKKRSAPDNMNAVLSYILPVPDPWRRLNNPIPHSTAQNHFLQYAAEDILRNYLLGPFTPLNPEWPLVRR